ncbi:MAG: transposase [Oscillatoria sp. SIO1A7]|nr:transposase [Oscillatoria sp. SIO1A7]
MWPELCETVSKHIKEICNYSIGRLTNGFIEGVNNKIKLVKRLGYGFTNMKNFRDRLMATFRYRASSSP